MAGQPEFIVLAGFGFAETEEYVTEQSQPPIVRSTAFFDDMLDLRVLSCDEGRFDTTLTFEDRLTNRNGALHGGIIAYIFDVTMSNAARTNDTNLTSLTLNMTINYLAPAQSDIRCSARVARRGNSIAFITADIEDAAGLQVANALGTFKIRNFRGRALPRG